MINKEKIPEDTYNELIDLFGYKKAEDIVNQKQYNYQGIQTKIIVEKLKKRFGKRLWLYTGIILLIIIIYKILQIALVI